MLVTIHRVLPTQKCVPHLLGAFPIIFSNAKKSVIGKIGLETFMTGDGFASSSVVAPTVFSALSPSSFDECPSPSTAQSSLTL